MVSLAGESMRFAFRHTLYWVALVAAISACSTSGNSLKYESKKPDAFPGMDGVWESDGYGFVFVVKSDVLQAYEVTKTTCVPTFKIALHAGSAPGADAAYVQDGQGFLLIATSDPNEKRLRGDGFASDRVIRRIAALPATCVQPTANTPEGNFEVFAQTFAENYISFDLKGADWQAIVAAARARVTSATTPDELFDIFEAMIAQFGDAHTEITAESIHRRYQGIRKGTDRLFKDGFDDFYARVLPRILSVTESKLQGPIRKYCNDKVQYGRLDDKIGYLRVLGEAGYVLKGEEDDIDAGQVALEAALDEVFSDRNLRGLVIDVRYNEGGYDPYGLAIVSRLATVDYLAYLKHARNDPVDRTQWTPGQSIIVRPSTRPGFKGPVVVLTGPLTVSAGETMTQALMGLTPAVVRIGENTQGVFSDILFRTLPNGWTFGLPNEVFRTPAGKAFDGPGIPPQIAVPVFADEDLAAGRDPGLERARTELLRRDELK
jgi:hypothetical protein